MIIDFRKNKVNNGPVTINDVDIDIIDSFKFLGSMISNDLKWNMNVHNIVKKCHQRMYFLRELKKFNLSKSILTSFYRCVIESVLTFSIIVLFSSITAEDEYKLNRIVRTASKIIDTQLPSLEELYKLRLRNRSNKIINDPSHPAHNIFQLLPSGRRYRSILAKTERYKNSLFPSAIRLLSDSINSS